MTIRLSVLDLAPVSPGSTAAESIAGSVALAQHAEARGYQRVWYAEHHNMPTIASSATAVLIAHVAAQTSTIRLGAGGIMLPNHPPLVIAEQFGTLEAMHPGRIDLGLGRAAGSDQNTARALRTRPDAGQQFPHDVQELRGYLEGESLIPGVQAVPGAGSGVPIYILGSSMFGARLAAQLGLPYAFASHFAPRLLSEAIATYRGEYTPSTRHPEPYLIAGLNVVAATTREHAHSIVASNRRAFARALLPAGQQVTDVEIDDLIRRGAGKPFDDLYGYMAIGEARDVTDYIQRFQDLTGAQEIITAHQAPELPDRLISIDLTATAITTSATTTPPTFAS